MSQTVATIESRLAASAVHGSRIAVFAVIQEDAESITNAHMLGVVVGVGNGQVTIAATRDPNTARRTFWLDTIVAVDPVPAVNPRPKQ